MIGVIILEIYVVKQGDSIYSIAKAYNVTPASIIAANELTNPDQLVVGQALVILPENRKHVVKRRETLYLIAAQYGVTVADIFRVNPTLSRQGLIYPGQEIIIPSNVKKLGTIEVNGYSFPNINIAILRRTLPNLTYLSIFSYEVKSDGSLTTINDVPLIQEARNYKVAPIMVITNIQEGKGFSSQLAHDILTNEAIQTKLIENIFTILKAKKYHGINIDFEYIFPYDKESYNNFIRKMSVRLHRTGYILITALAPKTSADQKGLLYEAHDYPVHGALVDRVILMTYEWGYTGGPPLPVAPLNEVQKVLNYAITAIPKGKILMGMPNYGYDWELPYIPTRNANTISNVEAVKRAFEFKASIKFDPTAQTPYFNYVDSAGKKHIVWFEDARSINAKLSVAHQYGLAGVSYWTIGRYFPQNWVVLNAKFNVKKVL